MYAPSERSKRRRRQLERLRTRASNLIITDSSEDSNNLDTNNLNNQNDGDKEITFNEQDDAIEMIENPNNSDNVIERKYLSLK
jgi:hypothetical protein